MRKPYYLLDELRVAPWDYGVDDIDAVDASFLPRGELICDMFRSAGNAAGLAGQ